MGMLQFLALLSSIMHAWRHKHAYAREGQPFHIYLFYFFCYNTRQRNRGENSPPDFFFFYNFFHEGMSEKKIYTILLISRYIYVNNTWNILMFIFLCDEAMIFTKHTDNNSHKVNSSRFKRIYCILSFPIRSKMIGDVFDEEDDKEMMNDLLMYQPSFYDVLV